MAQQLTFDDLDSETTTTDTVDPKNPPEDERVLLIEGIVGVMHTPRIIEGKTSSTGKTISVERDDRGTGVRLDAKTIFNGDGEYRDATSFELYTPETMKRRQQANHAPGPQAGCNEVNALGELPDPTHRPA